MHTPHESITNYLRTKFADGAPTLTMHLKNRPVDDADEWAEELVEDAFDNLDEIAQGLLDHLQSDGFAVGAIDPTRLS